MAFMRKAAVYLGLVEDDDEPYDEYEEYDTPQPAPAAPAAARRPVHDTDDYPRRASPDTRDRTAVHPAARVGGLATAAAVPTRVGWADDAGPVRVTTLHPRTYNEARAIGEHFREGTPVIMNLTEMDDSDAKRLVDFAAGLIFGLRGSIERVTNKVFLLSPHNVEVTAEDKQRLAEGGFFNQS